MLCLMRFCSCSQSGLVLLEVIEKSWLHCLSMHLAKVLDVPNKAIADIVRYSDTERKNQRREPADAELGTKALCLLQRGKEEKCR